MGKSTTNKKAKRVQLTKQKVKELQPKGEQSAQSKALLAKPLAEGGKTRYRGKARRVKEPTVKKTKDGEDATGKVLGAGVRVEKLKKEMLMSENEKKKRKAEGPKPVIFKGIALDKEARAEVLEKETEHLEFVLGNDEFQADPAAALLKHIDATLDPLKEAKGRHRYDPSRKKKLANLKEKEEKAKRTSASGQLEQLTGHQREIKKALDDHNAKKTGRSGGAAGKKDTPKKPVLGARTAGGGRQKMKNPKGDKPWMNPY